MDVFARHEERLQALLITPREYVARQIRVTPYRIEDVGRVTERVGPDILMFNIGHPHVEGGRRPCERFEASLDDATDEVRERFHADNFLDLMGIAMAALV